MRFLMFFLCCSTLMTNAACLRPLVGFNDIRGRASVLSKASLNRLTEEADTAAEGSSVVKSPTALFMRRVSVRDSGRDNNRNRFRWDKLTATNILIVLNSVIFLISTKRPDISMRFMKFDRAIARGQTYRLFTSLFLHGSFYHIMTNGYSLYQIGPMAERLFGTARFLTTYLAAGVFANIGTYIFKSSPSSLGASGCIFGLLGALAMHYYRNKAIIGPEAGAVLAGIKRTMLINIMYGFGMQGIDHGAHAGGFIGGAIFAYLFGPRLFVEKSRSSGRRVLMDRPLINYKPYWKWATARDVAQEISTVGTVGTGDSTGSSDSGRTFYPKRPSAE